MENLVYEYFKEANKPEVRTTNFWIFWIAIAMALIGVSAVLYGINQHMAWVEMINIGGLK